MIDNPAANRDIQRKKEKTHHFLVWRGAGWFRGFHLLLITDPAFGALESDPVLNFTRKSSSNFLCCFKTCNWHDALVWYFVASLLVQVLVTVSFLCHLFPPHCQISLKPLFCLTGEAEFHDLC